MRAPKGVTMPLCKLCRVIIPAVEDSHLDAGRDRRTFIKTAALVVSHVSQHHPEVLQGLVPIFADFQYLVCGFLLDEGVRVEGAPLPAWARGRDRVHESARQFLARESLFTVSTVAQPGDTGAVALDGGATGKP